MKRRSFLKTALVIGGVSLLDISKMNSLFAQVKTHTTKDKIQGMLFDIQRFGIHDGPGIRTVVFFKKCPLRCSWCFNPESQKGEPQLQFFKEKCNNCLICTKICKTGALLAVGNRLRVDYKKCTGCGDCVTECPQQAFKIIGYKSTVNEVVAIAKKDKDYYEKSGGVTLSGGEVMAQPEFALALLRELKKEGINTCIETCGRADMKYFNAILPYVDLFLYDYKLTDDNEHVRWTGVSNIKILKNLDFLCKKGARIVLRCPIIPTVNDNEIHFRAIAELGKQYTNIDHVEVEPYVSFGQSKYTQIGRRAYPFNFKSVDKVTAQKWIRQIKKNGYDKVRLS
ncbi:MAG: glycyl-radical enzyme activating protein [Paludibacter sp.]|nr:glycyl-radical enzyme activating protein [Paludibacter sp.]